jgi:hypothetical protein
MESTHARTAGTFVLTTIAATVSARMMICGHGAGSSAKAPVAPTTRAPASQARPLITTTRDDTGTADDVMVFIPGEKP